MALNPMEQLQVSVRCGDIDSGDCQEDCCRPPLFALKARQRPAQGRRHCKHSPELWLAGGIGGSRAGTNWDTAPIGGFLALVARALLHRSSSAARVGID